MGWRAHKGDGDIVQSSITSRPRASDLASPLSQRASSLSPVSSISVAVGSVWTRYSTCICYTLRIHETFSCALYLLSGTVLPLSARCSRAHKSCCSRPPWCGSWGTRGLWRAGAQRGSRGSRRTSGGSGTATRSRRAAVSCTLRTRGGAPRPTRRARRRALPLRRGVRGRPA